MKLGSELCALFRGTVFPPVETAGAEALWLERLVVSRQQEIEGVQERRGNEDLRLEGGVGLATRVRSQVILGVIVSCRRALSNRAT